MVAQNANDPVPGEPKGNDSKVSKNNSKASDKPTDDVQNDKVEESQNIDKNLEEKTAQDSSPSETEKDAPQVDQDKSADGSTTTTEKIPDSGESESTPLPENEELAEKEPKKSEEETETEEKSTQPEKNEVEETVEPEKQNSSEEQDESSKQNDNEESKVEGDTSDQQEKANDAPSEKSNEKADENIEMEVNKIDYSTLSKQELIDELKKIIEKRTVFQIRDDADLIKINFYKKHKAEIEQKKKQFIEDGGNIEEFSPSEDPLEQDFKDLFKEYRDIRADFNRQLEDEKTKNLEAKYKIIEEIKELVNRKESLNETFHEFRELQKRWRTVGLVPQQNVKDLWETYNHNVEKFYDYIKINKELRDLDLKKNLEAKLDLCEKAEELLLEADSIKAFKILQKYHDNWREIGPVPNEMRNEIWERFKETTTKINKKHQEFFEGLKDTQKRNLEQKKALCEQVEDIAASNIDSVKQWDEKSREIIELQKVWKTIGFAPKKDNNKVYQRFRAACDSFFNRKREFFSHYKEEQHNNLQLKTDLCIQAESLKDSVEWKKTTEDLIQIQKKWKEIGPVPRKYSDQLWKRFRSACDGFFNRKSDHFSNVDNKYAENLTKKQELIDEINNYKLSENTDENFKNLKSFQRRWTEIGFVPLKDKDEIQQKYREAINKHFDNMEIDDNKKNILRFKSRVDNLIHKPKANLKLNSERDKYVTKIKQLENDIVLWENNIGFFAKSKNAESMIEDVQNKIDDAKERIKLLEEKIKMIDNIIE